MSWLSFLMRWQKLSSKLQTFTKKHIVVDHFVDAKHRQRYVFYGRESNETAGKVHAAAAEFASDGPTTTRSSNQPKSVRECGVSAVDLAAPLQRPNQLAAPY
ncbi:hypothetical protein [Hydrogenophaga flava]|uniref:hypothetical protein n=1 Tax=Hydrogenophaga flava TaxID=65657 RepID=UPI0012FAC278|nr:hypothetical protein [Hydrogenophaga flava]